MKEKSNAEIKQEPLSTNSDECINSSGFPCLLRECAGREWPDEGETGDGSLSPCLPIAAPGAPALRGIGIARLFWFLPPAYSLQSRSFCPQILYTALYSPADAAAQSTPSAVIKSLTPPAVSNASPQESTTSLTNPYKEKCINGRIHPSSQKIGETRPDK